MTERNYYVAVLHAASASWAGEDTEDGHPTTADGPHFARAFTLEEAEAFVESHYVSKGHDWIKWAIFKMDLISSHRDAPLERLAKVMTEDA